MHSFLNDPMFLAEQKLGRLALEFRRSRDTETRQSIVDQYEKAVKDLISTGTWDRVPPPEDQLPDEVMPQTFFEYWDNRANDAGV